MYKRCVHFVYRRVAFLGVLRLVELQHNFLIAEEVDGQIISLMLELIEWVGCFFLS